MARLDYIPNSGDARSLAWQSNGKRRAANSRILQNQRDQLRFIDIEHLVFIPEAMPQTNLLYREFSELQLHNPF
jgi:hypothetical protein